MLHEINFCDWRSGQRRAGYFRSGVALVLVLSLLTLIQWQRWQDSAAEQQQQQWRLSQAQLAVAKLRLRNQEWQRREASHLQQSAELQQWQEYVVAGNRPWVVMTMIRDVLPQGVYLDELNMDGAQLYINGVVKQQIQAARFAADLQASNYADAVSQLRIAAPSERWQLALFPFQLQVRIKTLKQGDENE